jgi:hypothetical protein
MNNILTGRIDNLNFENGEKIRSTRAIRATRSTVAKLIYIYMRERCITVFYKAKTLILLWGLDFIFRDRKKPILLSSYF